MSYDRYKGADYVPDGNVYWLSPNYPILDSTPQADDRIHTVRDGDRLDLLAHTYFNDARLWWVIAEYNNVFWMFDIETGQQLRIPSFDHLYMDLLV